MNDLEKEKLAVKAYRLSEMSDMDWKKVMPKYGAQLKEWWIIPNIIWYLLLLAGPITIYFNLYYPWLPTIALIISYYAVAQIGSRAGNIEGFQIGFEWGKIDGVCRGLDINEEEQDVLLQKARELIVEFKAESGDPNLELGKSFRKNA
jgi:hypothetical protein